MILIAAVVLFFLIKIYRKQGVSPSLFLVASYFLVTLLGFSYMSMYEKEVYDYQYFSMLYYATCLAILFMPLLKISGFSYMMTFPPKVVKIVSIILIITGILSIYFTIVGFDFAKFALGWSEIRGEYYQETEAGLEASKNIFDRITWNFAFILYLAMPLGVQQLAQGNKKIGIMLLLSSFSIVVSSIVDAERQDLVTWIAGAIFSYLMWKNEMSRKVKKILRNSFVIIGVLIICLIVSITLSRFEDKDFWESFYAYAGMQPINAAYFLEKLSNQAQWGKINFPLFTGTNYVLLLNDIINAPISLNIFGSMIGSFYLDFGYLTIVIVTIISLFFYHLIHHAQRRHSFLAFYLYVTYFTMLFGGIFYFKFNSPPQERMVIMMGILIVLLERNFYKKNKKV